MEQDSLELYRERARAECEAALNASCAEARHVHAEMARAYARMAEIEELRRRGEFPPGKVTSMAETLHRRDEAEYGGHGPKPRPRRPRPGG